MIKNKIEITLIASKRAGILPILMGKLCSLGLIYRRCNVKEYNTGVKLTLVCEGELECEESYLIKSIKDVPDVESVLNVTQSNPGATESFDKTQIGISDFTELHPLRANDPITHDVLHIVEDRLSEIFGPTTNLLLKSAAKKSTRVGELFLILAEDLTDRQNVVFLRNIEGLDTILLNEA
ncbi:MAG: hypothetical protein V7749_05235 [Cocleimonas sp.]